MRNKLLMITWPNFKIKLIKNSKLDISNKKRPYDCISLSKEQQLTSRSRVVVFTSCHVSIWRLTRSVWEEIRNFNQLMSFSHIFPLRRSDHFTDPYSNIRVGYEWVPSYSTLSNLHFDSLEFFMVKLSFWLSKWLFHFNGSIKSKFKYDFSTSLWVDWWCPYFHFNN